MAEPTITISLSIENTYEDGDTITTTVTDEVVPSPEHSDLHDWAWDHLYDFTGTGRTEGDSWSGRCWYDVTVTACSEPTLVGKTFEFKTFEFGY